MDNLHWRTLLTGTLLGATAAVYLTTPQSNPARTQYDPSAPKQKLDSTYASQNQSIRTAQQDDATHASRRTADQDDAASAAQRVVNENEALASASRREQEEALASAARRATEEVEIVSAARRVTIAQLVTRAEQCFPENIATISFEGETRTYGEFAKRIRAAAAGLVRDLGVMDKDRVGILAMNSETYLECFFAVPFAGGITVPLNTRLARQELTDILNDCDMKILIVDECFFSMADELSATVKTLTKIITLKRISLEKDVKYPGNSTEYEDLITKHERDPLKVPAVDTKSSDIYGLFYTGGTTGKSKGVCLSNEGLIMNAYAIVNVVRYKEGIRYLHAGPMFHLADGASTFGVTLMGATHVFVPKFIPDHALRAIQEHKVTHTLWVPSMFQLCLALPNVKDYDLKSMRCFLYGASPMLEKVLVDSMLTFPSASFVQGYGMTEASPCLTFLGPEYHVAKNPYLTSIGQCVPHGELKIFDENDIEVPRGTIGEICFRGPNVMLGYWRMPETTKTTLRNGYLHTGDGGRMDEKGFVWICDRIKDIIVSGGENVYSPEVEGVLMQIKGVLGCAVIGIPDPMLVEKVCAVLVVGRDSVITQQNVMEFCKSKIAGYKCPRHVVFRQEPLPLSGAGKVLKTELRKPFWENFKGPQIYSTEEKNSSYDNAGGR